MNDDNQLYNLSRRKLLGGIGAVGLASAGAGLGTSAYFNDVEEFVGNSLTAGELDLSVAYEIVGTDSFHAAAEGTSGVLNGDTLSLVVEDVKPGDWAAVCLDLSVEDNPSYVRVTGELTEDAENSVTEPEYNHSVFNGTNMEDNVPGGSFDPGDGELAEEILVTVGESYTDADPNDNVPGQIVDPEPGIGPQSTLADVMALLESGFTVRGDDGHGEAGDNATAVGNSSIHGNLVDADVVSYCFLFELPADVGNWVQSDSVGFDLTFEAIQTRHNDANDPFAALDNSSN
jgi:predicted ribosomally synthesized peptide with SipW-like signal peptide